MKATELVAGGRALKWEIFTEPDEALELILSSDRPISILVTDRVNYRRWLDGLDWSVTWMREGQTYLKTRVELPYPGTWCLVAWNRLDRAAQVFIDVNAVRPPTFGYWRSRR